MPFPWRPHSVALWTIARQVTTCADYWPERRLMNRITIETDALGAASAEAAGSLVVSVAVDGRPLSRNALIPSARRCARTVGVAFYTRRTAFPAACSRLRGRRLPLWRGRGRFIGKTLCQLGGLVAKVIVWDDAIDQAEAVRFRRIDPVSKHHQLHRLRRTDKLAEKIKAAQSGINPIFTKLSAKTALSLAAHITPVPVHPPRSRPLIAASTGCGIRRIFWITWPAILMRASTTDKSFSSWSFAMLAISPPAEKARPPL